MTIHITISTKHYKTSPNRYPSSEQASPPLNKKMKLEEQMHIHYWFRKK